MESQIGLGLLESLKLNFAPGLPGLAQLGSNLSILFRVLHLGRRTSLFNIQFKRCYY